MPFSYAPFTFSKAEFQFSQLPQMDSCRFHLSSLTVIPTVQTPFLQPSYETTNINFSNYNSRRFRSVSSMMRPLMAEETTPAFSYKKFINSALEETKNYTHLSPSPLQDYFNCSTSMDGKTELQMLSSESPKIRLLRSLSIEGSDGMQVLDFAAFPRPEFDLPIFCANFFSTASMNIIVLDLNPLYDVTSREDYKEKYYKHLIPLGVKHTELLPWGGKITAESIKFFSPIVIWTKFSPDQHKYDALYSAFKDYLKSWLELMNQATEETSVPQIMSNLEAQHRYLTWRAEKDPGHQLLRRLVGETLAKDIVRKFLFNGADDMGTKTFIDYFPEYKSEDGNVSKKRSMVGKSFENRPWDERGEFIATNLK